MKCFWMAFAVAFASTSCSDAMQRDNRNATAKCEISNLSAGFSSPKSFEGKVFCGEAYYYEGVGAFYPRAMTANDPARLDVAVVVSPDDGVDNADILSQL